ncbi:hypothetical protein QCA50_014808 [Cerrena zonata]|uniref:Uncharacterized protein n=1 Tax=Cerrena zonata TaxID=2478898 RepID=A0AAW0FNG3_9APHY
MINHLNLNERFPGFPYSLQPRIIIMVLLLPPEILFEIVTAVLVDYLESIMPDPTLIGQFTLETPLPPHATAIQVEDIAAEEIGDDYFSIVGPYDRNHFAPLLQTSYQIREIALSVLSDHLGIPMVDGRLSARPWPFIQKILQLYTNPKCTLADMETVTTVNASPILQAYGNLACMQWMLWKAVQLDSLGITHTSEIRSGVEHMRDTTHPRDGSFIPQKPRYQGILLISRCLVYVLQSTKEQSEGMFDFDNRSSLPRYDDLTSMRDYLTFMLLEEVRWWYLECAITLDEMVALPPDVATEVLKDDFRTILYPMLVKIMEGTRNTPEYESCKELALQMLEDMVFISSSSFSLSQNHHGSETRNTKPDQQSLRQYHGSE